MKSKTVLIFVAAALVAAASPAPGLAQNIGLQIAIAPAPIPTPAQFGFPGQAPAVAPRGTFTGVPAAMLVPAQQPFPGMSLVPNFPTVFIPNQVLIPGQPIFPAQVVNPSPGFGWPANTYQPNYQPAPFVPQGHQGHHVPPPAGTPRGEVLRQFGAPSLTVITSTGETLHFTGGVTVIIQNGQVAGPR